MGAFGTGTLLNRGKGFSWHQREGALFLCPWRKQSLPRTLRHQAVVEAQNLPPPLSFLQHPAPHGKNAAIPLPFLREAHTIWRNIEGIF